MWTKFSILGRTLRRFWRFSTDNLSSPLGHVWQLGQTDVLPFPLL